MDDLMQLMEEIGLPFAYDHFAEGEAVDPPFVTFLILRSVASTLSSSGDVNLQFKGTS